MTCKSFVAGTSVFLRGHTTFDEHMPIARQKHGQWAPERFETWAADNVQLDLFSPGRAIFKVVCDNEPSGMVELHLGYQVANMQPYFLGVIESKHQSNGHWFLTCRELLGALSFPEPMAIRHATVSAVLNELSHLGLEFIYPNTQIPNTPNKQYRLFIIMVMV
mgnify:CR=1 FL=1